MPLTDAEKLYDQKFTGEAWSKSTLSKRSFEACHFQRCDFGDALDWTRASWQRFAMAAQLKSAC